MSKTRQEFIADICVASKRTSLGQVTTAEDYAEIDNSLDGWLDEIEAVEVFYIPDRQNFDERGYAALVDAVASFDPMFSAADKGVDVLTFRESAYARLRRITAASPQYTVQKAEYF